MNNEDTGQKTDPQVVKDCPIYEFRERRVFSAVINNKLYEVWERKEEHKLGEWNGDIKNWWVKYIVNNGEESKIEWVPWLPRHTNRPAWDINIKIGNDIRFRHDDWDVSKSGYVEIKCNLRMVYRFNCRDLDYACVHAQHIIHTMQEHPFCFWEPDSEIGRKVYYHNQPAIVSGLYLDQGEIYLTYDGDKNGFDMTHPWDGETDWPVSSWNGEKEVRDDILTPSIWWFRK